MRGWGRWWIYQKERFPVVGHGVLILAFSSSAVAYSAMLRGDRPAWWSVAAAFVTCFILFLQLRVADEFKDFEEDSRYRPYRAVPRGLVTLRELGVVFVVGCLIQLAVALWLRPSLALLLVGVWVYLALMSKEFFVREWLKARPFTYMWSHMLIMPQVDLYATACDWWAREFAPRGALFLFLWVSFFNGMVIEIGRKIRAPGDEEEGVDTYSRVWGMRGAVMMWLAAMAVTGGFALAAARRIGFAWQEGVVMGALLCVAAMVSIRFLKGPEKRWSKGIETVSGVWTLAMYLGLGLGPLAWRWWRGT